MFRKGGEVGGGITSGMRTNFENGTELSDREQYEEIINKYREQAVDPVAQLLIQGGLRGMSTAGRGGTLANLAAAFEQPTGQLFQNIQRQKDLQREAELTGLEMDISERKAKEALELEEQRIKDAQEFQEKLLGKKQAFDIDKIGVQSEADINELIKKYELEDQYKDVTDKSNLQKDYSPQRAYEDLVSKRTESRAGLAPFAKPNVEQAFPRATAEYDTYILRNLRATDNPLGQEIRANNFGIVPYNEKEESFDIPAMIPGGYYFYPPRRIFVVNEPPTDESEGGLFMINPYTFEKVRYQGN
tara:strand:+ start:336 stop:1241 length:906 start_codon:yes stop_codon:yes gene_type:complete